MTFVIEIHLGSAILALLTGGLVLLMPKGTRVHRRIGYLFALALVVVNVSALNMYHLTGTFNFLHVFALISLLSLGYGLIPAIRRRDNLWQKRHIKGMTGASLGVWAAGFAELVVRVLPTLLSPGWIIAIAVGVGIIFFFLIGWVIDSFTKRHSSSI